MPGDHAVAGSGEPGAGSRRRLSPRDSQHREAGRQEPFPRQVVERGNELALGQVAGRTEEHDAARPRHHRRGHVATERIDNRSGGNINL